MKPQQSKEETMLMKDEVFQTYVQTMEPEKVLINANRTFLFFKTPSSKAKVVGSEENDYCIA